MLPRTKQVNKSVLVNNYDQTIRHLNHHINHHHLNDNTNLNKIIVHHHHVNLNPIRVKCHGMVEDINFDFRLLFSAQEKKNANFSLKLILTLAKEKKTKKRVQFNFWKCITDEVTSPLFKWFFFLCL